MDMTGLKVVAVRKATKKELSREMWDTNNEVTVIEFDNGDVIYPSADYEGNGPGAIFGYIDGKTITLIHGE